MLESVAFVMKGGIVVLRSRAYGMMENPPRIT